MGLGDGDACFTFVWFYLSQGIRSNITEKGWTNYILIDVFTRRDNYKTNSGKKKYLYVTEKLKDVFKHAIKKKGL